jgi:hypothetical protein
MRTQLTDKGGGSAAHAQHFLRCNRLERVAEVGVATRLYFADNEHAIAPRHDVELTARASPVAGDNDVTVALVPSGNKVFSPGGSCHA